MGAERADFWLFASSEVNSPLATTIENTEKFRRSDQAENGLSREVGGVDGPDFQPSLGRKTVTWFLVRRIRRALHHSPRGNAP